MNDLLTSFSPIVDREPTLLILGSMPGVESLTQQRYYAHPRNAFWPIICSYFSLSETISYAQRCELLKQQRIALWDVLKNCRRTGSLDQHIEADSMIANDFVTLFTDYPSISEVFFNGAKAAQLFNRYVHKSLNAVGIYIQQTNLPSTSPAYAAMRFAQKQQLWHQALAAHQHSNRTAVKSL